MLRCAVVEDEILIRKNMVKKIKACGADIEVVCEAGNGWSVFSVRSGGGVSGGDSGNRERI